MDNSLNLYVKRFFSGTLLSRISGMGRDVTMAFAFGDHPSVAAFMVAFRLSNLFRRLLGEGPLQSAFIPHFEGLRVQDPAKASYFFRKLVLLMTFLLLFITGLSEGALYAVSYLDLSEGSREIVSLTAWLLPGLVFICLYGLNISLLNCYDSFFIPSFAPFISNMIWIVAAFCLRHYHPSLAMRDLAIWVVVGFMGQWLITLPLTLKCVAATWKEWLGIKIPPEVIGLAKSFSLGAIGVGAMQINAFADSCFARYADIRGPIYLWYSIRLEQLALAIFGITCVTTITPRLSRAIKTLSLEMAQELFSLSYQRIMVIMIPCTFAIFALGLPAVNLIYGRGSFSAEAVYKTTSCLCAYGLGLVPSTLILLYSAIFYAKEQFRIPMWIALFTVVASLFLNFVFIFILDFGVISTALATSFTAWVNSLILSKMVRRMAWQSHYSFARVGGVLFASLFASCAVIAIDYFFFQGDIWKLVLQEPQNLQRSMGSQLLCFFSQFALFTSTFLLYAQITKNGDILEFVQQLFLRKKSLPTATAEG